MPGTGTPPAAGDHPRALVLAAGAVLWRYAPSADSVELALIHRPKYDDWSFPKGKLDPGESPAEAAVREVREETGYDCALGAALPTRWYVTDGRRKEVRYWCATPTGGSFAANREVDRLLWLPPAAARACLSHEHDRPLVDAALRRIADAPRDITSG